MADVIELTDQTARVTVSATQALGQAVDVGGYDELELLLGVLEIVISDGYFTVQVLTGTQTESELGWRVATTFSDSFDSNTWQKRTVTGLLRYVRWSVVATGSVTSMTFSLRGMARRGRRGLEPTDVANLAAWYRADLGVTLNTTTVSAWADQSGYGRDLTQSSGSLQPLFTPNAIREHPALTFDGVDDYLGPVAFTMTQPWTLFMVYKQLTISAPGNHDVISDGGVYVGTGVLAADTTPRTLLYAGSTVANTAVVGNQVYAQVTGVFNTTASALRANRVVAATGNVGSSDPNGFTLGALVSGAWSCKFEVAEVVIYSALMVPSDRDAVEWYLARRYGL